MFASGEAAHASTIGRSLGLAAIVWQAREEESPSFLKKRSKKLFYLPTGRMRMYTPGAAKQIKVFWFFFSRKNTFLPRITIEKGRVAPYRSQ